MNIATAIRGDSARVSPYGDIDFDSLVQLRACVSGLPATVIAVEFDLGHVPFMDMAGLHLLGEAQGSPGRAVTVAHLQPQPQRLLEMAASVFPHRGWDRYVPGPLEPQSA
ncbi:STAS domain-containing protein [Streptomyces bauhiniae]|uniref:STAS domain-containing protein n=1 Tax=Streptomyces bauhiniae TaxID=2340725 RepID=UPI00331A453C